jgi:hypothetical protein
MRLIVFFLLLSFSSEAQIIRANPFYVGRVAAAPAGDTLILDSFPSAAGWSVRKLRTAYTGNCMRVRRTLDNTEQDIGFVNNFLDTASLKTFAGTSNLRVTTWYDQSGNGRDASQSTAANQPKIYDSATASIPRRNNVIAMTCDAGNLLSITTGLNIFQNVGYAVIFGTACNTTSSGQETLLTATTGTSAINARINAAYNLSTAQRNNIQIRRLDADGSGNFLGSSNFSLTNLELTVSRMEWANAFAGIYRNNGTVRTGSFGTAGNTSNTASQSMRIADIIGDVVEIIAYNTDVETNRTAITDNIRRNFLFY